MITETETDEVTWDMLPTQITLSHDKECRKCRLTIHAGECAIKVKLEDWDANILILSVFYHVACWRKEIKG